MKKIRTVGINHPNENGVIDLRGSEADVLFPNELEVEIAKKIQVSLSENCTPHIVLIDVTYLESFQPRNSPVIRLSEEVRGVLRLAEFGPFVGIARIHREFRLCGYPVAICYLDHRSLNTPTRRNILVVGE